MSRSGYTDDCGHIELYRASVDRALKGARGQHFLRKLRAALDAMPVKRLITAEFQDAKGDVCALGSLDPEWSDVDDRHATAKHFGIAESMAAEIMYMNDEWYVFRDETPEQRWTRMRAWVEDNILVSHD